MFESRELEENDIIGGFVKEETENRDISDRARININKKKFQEKCEACDYICARKNMKKHIESVHDGIKYKCNLCDLETSRTDSLTRHVKVAHAPNKYFCNKCDGAFRSEFGLSQHIKKNHMGHTYSCDHCDFRASSIKHLKGHIGRIHHEESKLMGSYLCEQCNFIAESRINLLKHVENHNPHAFSCDQCYYKTKNSVLLKGHKNTEHRKRDVYECDQCNYTATRNQNMLRHTEKEHLDVMYICPDCDFVAKGRDYIQKHVRKYHKRSLDKSYFATIAKPNAIKKKNVLEDKMMITYLCDQCDYRGSHIKNLEEHIRRQHSKLLCDECDFMTDTERNLMIHKKQEHKGLERPIKKNSCSS